MAASSLTGPTTTTVSASDSNSSASSASASSHPHPPPPLLTTTSTSTSTSSPTTSTSRSKPSSSSSTQHRLSTSSPSLPSPPPPAHIKHASLDARLPPDPPDPSSSTSASTSASKNNSSSRRAASVSVSLSPSTSYGNSNSNPNSSSTSPNSPASSSPPLPASSAPSSPSKQGRPVLAALAALARDKTSAIVNLAEPALRSRPSSGSLYRASLRSPTLEQQIQKQQREASLPHAASSAFSSASSAPSRSATPVADVSRAALLETDPPSQAYSNTSTDHPAPVTTTSGSSKMHQTSSRLLRMTSDDRPFTRDFEDLFATLVVSLPLGPHRVRLTRIEHSFLSEEAINNLGSLKFSQSNRMPDPKDPSRIVTTTTTTTFSMAREMARSVCQRFLEARFVESADGKQAREFTLKGSVWHLTPKGIHVLERFCLKNGIMQRHVTELVNSSRNTMQLVILERDSETDKLSSDRSTIEVIFRRFIGQNGPNVKVSTSSADSDSLSEYKDGIAGVRMASERRLGSPPRTFYQTFTGKASVDWLMDCCTTVDRREAAELASLFLEQELLWCVSPDRTYLAQLAQDKSRPANAAPRFQPTRPAIYQLTQKGKDVLNMVQRDRTSESDGASAAPRPGVSRDSNTQKLDKILSDPALRLLFRENLRDTHCEENLSFYLDVGEFLKTCRAAIRTQSPSRSDAASSASRSLDVVKETMASAYGIYNAFLAPGSPCELNIDHLLRNQLATRMTKAVGQDSAMIDSLKEVTRLFEDAQVSVFKLMASDSVPKFMKSAKYEQTLKNYDFDSITTRQASHAPERSISRADRGERAERTESSSR